MNYKYIIIYLFIYITVYNYIHIYYTIYILYMYIYTTIVTKVETINLEGGKVTGRDCGEWGKHGAHIQNSQKTSPTKNFL